MHCAMYPIGNDNNESENIRSVSCNVQIQRKEKNKKIERKSSGYIIGDPSSFYHYT
jgi:hypothetical protein